MEEKKSWNCWIKRIEEKGDVIIIDFIVKYIFYKTRDFWDTKRGATRYLSFAGDKEGISLI